MAQLNSNGQVNQRYAWDYTIL